MYMRHYNLLSTFCELGQCASTISYRYSDILVYPNLLKNLILLHLESVMYSMYYLQDNYTKRCSAILTGPHDTYHMMEDTMDMQYMLLGTDQADIMQHMTKYSQM